MENSEEETTPVVKTRVTPLYCKVCTYPTEFCEFHVSYTKCKRWLIDNHPKKYDELYGVENVDDEQPSDAAPSKPGRKRGGKGLKKNAGGFDESSSEEEDAVITLTRTQRNKRKWITVISGMEAFEQIKLADACKQLQRKFACGAACEKGKTDIHVHLDAPDDIAEFIQATWGISEDNIDIADEKPANLGNNAAPKGKRAKGTGNGGQIRSKRAG